MQAGPSRKSGHKPALSPPKASDTPELTPDNSTCTTTPPLATPRLAANPLDSRYKTKDILDMSLPEVYEIIDQDDWGFPDPTLTYEWNPDWDELCGRKPSALYGTETRPVVRLPDRRSRSPHQASGSVAPAAAPRQLEDTLASGAQHALQTTQATPPISVDASQVHATGSRTTSPYSTPASSSSLAAACTPVDQVSGIESDISAIPSSSRQNDSVVRQRAPATAIPSATQTPGSIPSTGTSSTSTGSLVRSSSSVSSSSEPSKVVASVPQVHVEHWDVSTTGHRPSAPVKHYSTAVDSGNTTSILAARISDATPALCGSPAVADTTPGRVLSTGSVINSSAILPGNHSRKASTGRDDIVSPVYPAAAAQQASLRSPAIVRNGAVSPAMASSMNTAIALPRLPAAISTAPNAISRNSRANYRTVDPPPTATPSATNPESSAMSPVPGPSAIMSPALASTSLSPLVNSVVPEVGSRSGPRPPMSQLPTPVVNHQASVPQHEQARRVQVAQHTAIDQGPHPQGSATASRNPRPRTRAEVMRSIPPERLRMLQRLYASGETGWRELQRVGFLRMAHALFGPPHVTATQATAVQASRQPDSSPMHQPMSPMYSSQHLYGSQVASGSGSAPHVYASPAATAAQHDVRMHQWAQQRAQQSGLTLGRVENMPPGSQSPAQYMQSPQPGAMLPQGPSQVQQQTPVPTPQEILDASYAGQRAVPLPQYYGPNGVPGSAHMWPPAIRSPATGPYAPSPSAAIPSPSMMQQGIPRQYAPEANGGTARNTAAASTPGSVYQPGSSYNSPSLPPQTPLAGPSRLPGGLYPGTPPALRDPRGRCKPCGDLRLSNREEAVKHLREVHQIDRWPMNKDGKTCCQFNPEHGPVKDMMRHVLSGKHLGGMDQCPRCGTWVGWRDDRHECVAKRKRDDDDELDDEMQRKRMR